MDPTLPMGDPPSYNRKKIMRPGGQEVWHGVTPVRFATELPDSVKGPIRSRAVRAAKNPNAIALDPEGTPQQPSQTPPKRN